jgi:hypothetical protein
LADSGPKSFFLPRRSASRSVLSVRLNPAGRGLLVPPDRPWTEILGPAGSQLPSPKARSCPIVRKPKLSFRRWRCANRSPAFRRADLWIRRSAGPACPVPLPPEGDPFPGFGRLTKPAAFASAKGQARSFRLAAASSAALPFRFVSSSSGGTRRRVSLRAVAGKLVCAVATKTLWGNCVGAPVETPGGPDSAQRGFSSRLAAQFLIRV